MPLVLRGNSMLIPEKTTIGVKSFFLQVATDLLAHRTEHRKHRPHQVGVLGRRNAEPVFVAVVVGLDIGAELLFPQTSLSSSVPANTFGPGFPPVNMAGRTDNEDSVFALPTMALSYRPEESPFTYGMGIFAVAGFAVIANV